MGMLDPAKIDKIVVFRTDRIGEVVLSTPVIGALKKNFSHAEITFVTSAYSKGIALMMPDVREVITFDTIDRGISFFEAVSLGMKLKAKGFDLAVVLNPHKALHLAVFLAGIRYRLGFDRKWGLLLTHKRKDRRAEGRMHEAEYNLALLDAIGIRREDIAPSIEVLSNDTRRVKAVFEERGIAADKRKIVIHPGTSNPAKQWPVENFIELAKMLGALDNVSVIITGSRDEMSMCEKIAAAGGGDVVSLAGLFTLGELAALFKATDLLISNDNGPMHIAAAVGLKVIAIFRKRAPGAGRVRWAPYGRGHVVLCRERIEEISPSEVLKGTVLKGTPLSTEI